MYSADYCKAAFLSHSDVLPKSCYCIVLVSNIPPDSAVLIGCD